MDLQPTIIKALEFPSYVLTVRTDILTNSPDNREGDDPEWEDGGVASSDGIIEPTDVAEVCMGGYQ